MTLPVHCLIVGSRADVRRADPQAAGLLADAHALGVQHLAQLKCFTLFFLEGHLSVPQQERLAAELLSDPVAQTSAWRGVSGGGVAALNKPDTHVIETALRPGVTDPVAEQIVHYARVLGLSGVTRAATGQRFVLRGPLTDADLHHLALRLLANPVIQHYAFGPITPTFPQAAGSSESVEMLPIRELDEAQLMTLSRERRAALDLAEMQAVQAYFRTEGRDPTDVEFETIAQTWSEHCVHKTFKARISMIAPGGGSLEVNGLLRTYLRSATETIAAHWVRSAFVDNAGILAFDDEFDVAFKVETHNHPSAIEPFGGANTGVGGVIRDVLGVSAKPIAATDVLCFGPQNQALAAALPDGVLPPRRVRSGVVAGVRDYGNKMGLPTVSGAIWYDPGYTANPLVFCGCVGLVPVGSHPRGPQAGDRVIVLGGRTGRDGLRGATFSSMAMDAKTGEVAGASVQIGDPITEKGLVEVITRARDAQLYHAITDCGAGGLSSAVGEMASDLGAAVDLAQVRLKYAGLAPWEIWLSEAQERMVLAVAPGAVSALQTICAVFSVELTDIGVFTGDGRLHVCAGERLVLDLSNAFLHGGIPQRCLTAEPATAPGVRAAEMPVVDYAVTLLRLLAHPNIASKADVIRGYDHEVQGGTVVKPLTGACNDGPSDAVVLRPIGTRGLRGVVLSTGLNPEYGKRDAYAMALSVVDESVRNAVATGADPARLALLDNFCWGDPLRPATLGALLAAAQGCHDAALRYGAPFVSGKDSLNNEFLGADGLRHAIPPTLLISAIGQIEDVRCAVTTDLKEAGDVVYLVGEAAAEFGGSHLGLLGDLALAALAECSPVPRLPASAPVLYAALHAAMQAGRVRACHDLSEGGLAVAAAEMCLGGRLGLNLSLPAGEPLRQLFGECNGTLLVAVGPGDSAAFEAVLAGQLVRRLGEVTSDARLTISGAGTVLLSVPVGELVAAWNTPAGEGA
ncbi:MAG: phosphoribosylformylglycinamidine synthase subunit PurL [Anaerolineales bacterium]|nr:phosphoribosylformylglycinamidine synthase subunit PurL [Anaerolineales bacterium]